MLVLVQARRAVAIFVVLVATLALIPSAAHAASLSVAVSADPTEDLPVTLTITGQADTATRLYVFRYSGSAACPARLDGVSYLYELSGTVSYSLDGDAVGAGSYSRQYAFTPTDTTPSRVCAYLSTTSGSAPSAAATALVTARAANASLTISSSADPAEEAPVELTVSGSAEVDRRLFVFVYAGSVTCAAQPSSVSYIYELSGTSTYSIDGSPIAAGAFTRTFSFTPPDSGTYRVCAYVAKDGYSVADTAAARSVVVREPTATVNLATSAGPIEESPVTITASGSTEADRRLYVFAHSGTAPCPAEPSGLSYIYELSGTATYTTDGVALAAGAFSRTFSFTPPEAGTYRLCAHIAETAYDNANATTTGSFTAVDPAAQVAVSVSPSEYDGGETLTVTANAQSAADRRLYVFARPAESVCPASPTDISYQYELTGTASYASDGTPLAAGSPFARDLSFIAFGDVTAYRVCAYVSESYADAPEAVATTIATRRARPAPITVSVPAVVGHGQAAPIVASGYSEGAANVSTYVSSASVACASTAAAQARSTGVTTVTGATAVSGRFAVPGSYGPAAAGEYRVCAYLTPVSRVDATVATARFRIEPDPALVPALEREDGDEERDRLLLIWRRGANGTSDRVVIYDERPDDASEPIGEFELDSDELDVQRDGDLVRARVRRHLGYGTFFWQVIRSRGKEKARSTVRSLVVVPRPLLRKAAKAKAKLTLRSSSRRAGTARLVITSSPMAKVRVVVKHAGRTVARRTFTEGVGGTRGIKFPLSCRRTGSFSYTVTIRDPYGTSVTRRGAWRVSAARCAGLVAKEQAAARRKAAKRRADKQPEPESGGGGSGGGGSGSGGSGGCDGDPNATPYPQFPGQRDGDGDGCYGET